MRTVVLRKMAYADTFIYVLQFGFTFQYLFAWDSEVYRQEVILRPNFLSWRLWAWRLGQFSSPYTQIQLDQGEQIVISGAMKSIEMLKADSSGKQRRKAEIKAKEEQKKTEACSWQARSEEDGKPMLLCLTHNLIAPIEENKKPVHS